MKKQFIVVGILLIMTSALNAVSANEVLQRFNMSFGGLFGQGHLFDKKNITDQNKNLSQWANAVAVAKSFVVDNSKNLLGVQDSDLINAIKKIETANMDLVNAIKITRGVSSQNDFKKQAAIFARIENEMKALGRQIESKFFALDNKKEAQRIIVAVARFTESGANKAQKDISNPSAPSGLPPVYQG